MKRAPTPEGNRIPRSREAPPRYPSPPAVMWEQCPISTTMGALGRKWTVPILRDVAFFPKASFGLIRKCNPGLRQRTLSLRLQQLAREDFIRRVVPPEDPRHPYYELTAKGSELWPILTSLLLFGIRHYSREVFADGRPRTLEEIYPNDAPLMLGPLAAFARAAGIPPGPMPAAKPTKASPAARAAPR
jgi:DNA-binding HxlR family transcriptional regulator